jgi:hypothetical protein
MSSFIAQGTGTFDHAFVSHVRYTFNKSVLTEPCCELPPVHLNTILEKKY